MTKNNPNRPCSALSTVSDVVTSLRGGPRIYPVDHTGRSLVAALVAPPHVARPLLSRRSVLPRGCNLLCRSSAAFPSSRLAHGQGWPRRSDPWCLKTGVATKGQACWRRGGGSSVSITSPSVRCELMAQSSARRQPRIALSQPSNHSAEYQVPTPELHAGTNAFPHHSTDRY